MRGEPRARPLATPARSLASAIAIVLIAAACGKGTPAGGAPAAATKGAAPSVDDGGGRPTDPREVAAWAEAQRGDEEERMRLADLVGCEGLQAGAASPDLRVTAIRAMAYCRDFGELPWLAEIGVSGPDGEAVDALDSVVEQAARPRRANDPEDAEELHEGCGALLALAREARAPRERRVRAVRALRMLADRGCVPRASIPTDLDAK